MADPAQTADAMARVAGHWERTGLGYWTARLRTDLPAPELPAGLLNGAVVGTGGCGRDLVARIAAIP